MAVEVVMPRLGWTMETGILAEWLKHDGDMVQEGDILFTVETDKVAQEVEALDSGILRIPPDSAPLGSAIAVGAVLAYLVQPGEVPPFGSPAAGTAPAAAVPVGAAGQAAASQTGLPMGRAEANGQVTPAASPRARRVAKDLGVDWTVLAGSSRSGRIVERDVRAAAAQASVERPKVSPVARRVAQQAGVDVGELAANLPGKRIMRADVEALIPTTVAPVEAAGQLLSPIRRTIAQRMSESAHAVAAVTLTTEADATELALVRDRMKLDLAGSTRKPPSYTDLFVRLTALALLDHPALNSALQGDRLVQHTAVHMGIAVDTERGLLVPVLRDADRKSVGSIAEESTRLIAEVRAGKLSAAALSGSTFTITNLGMYEIDAFTPIINLPECAILGIGRLVSRLVVVDEDAGTTAIRKMLTLSLTFDHRVVDGAPAARFLQQVKRWIERPYAWLGL